MCFSKDLKKLHGIWETLHPSLTVQTATSSKRKLSRWSLWFFQFIFFKASFKIKMDSFIWSSLLWMKISVENNRRATQMSPLIYFGLLKIIKKLHKCHVWIFSSLRDNQKLHKCHFWHHKCHFWFTLKTHLWIFNT